MTKSIKPGSTARSVGGKGRIRTEDTSFWNVPREYHVKGDYVKAGTNVVAIRAFDANGIGGLWGAAGETMLLSWRMARMPPISRWLVIGAISPS